MTSKGKLDKMKRVYAENCSKMIATRREQYKRNAKQISKMKHDRRVHISGGCPTVCKMLEKHHTKMKDDPESLSTEFMQMIIGRDCTED